MPQLWVIAGPNGAGKSTFADRWFAKHIPVVSPDTLALAGNLSPIQAGRAAIREQERLLEGQASFAVDTTFSGSRELALMKRATGAGYKVNLFYIGVRDVTICHTRIDERVEGGGHDVPAEDVLRRFTRSLENLSAAFDLADRVFVLDNTKARRRLVFSYEQGRVKHMSPNLPDWARYAIPLDILQSRNKGLGH